MSDNFDSTRIANEWLQSIKDQSRFIPLDGQKIRFNTPFIDPFSDEISLLIVSNFDSTYTISDQGYTIWNLESRGINITKKGSTRLNLIKNILNMNQTKSNNTFDIYKTVSSRESIAQAINDVLDSVIKVSDLAYSNRNNTRSIFKDDVLEYIAQNKEKFSVDLGLSVKGKSNLIYDLDFVFRPQLKISKWAKLYTTLNKTITEMIMGIWLDTENYRNQNIGNNTSFNIIVQSMDFKSERFKENLIQHNINVISFENKADFKKNFEIIA